MAIVHGREIFPECGLNAARLSCFAPLGGRDAEKTIDVIECEERKRVLASAKLEMDDFLAELGDASGSVDSELMDGSADAILADFIEKQWPDLVVTETDGRAGRHEASIEQRR